MARAQAGALAGLVLVLAPQAAQACKPMQPEGISALRPTWPVGSGVELREELLEFDCQRERPRTVCKLRVRYVYDYDYDPGESGETAGVWSWESQGELLELQVSFDGTALELQPPPPGMYLLGEARLELPTRGEGGDQAATVEMVVEVEAELSLDTDDFNGCVTPMGLTRHPLISYPPQVASVRTGWRGDESGGHTRLKVRPPRGWSTRTWPPAKELGASKLEQLQFEHPGVMHGPVAAAGVGFGAGVRPRLRAGYELSVPGFMIYSLAVEGDVQEELALIPAIELAAPSMWVFIPGPGIGVGVPVMLLPDPRPGFRVQASLNWSFIGLVGNFDVYPAGEGLPQALRGALMLQLSL